MALFGGVSTNQRERAGSVRTVLENCHNENGVLLEGPVYLGLRRIWRVQGDLSTNGVGKTQELGGSAVCARSIVACPWKISNNASQFGPAKAGL
jgi:hypothetical protein